MVADENDDDDSRPLIQVQGAKSILGKGNLLSKVWSTRYENKNNNATISSFFKVCESSCLLL